MPTNRVIFLKEDIAVQETFISEGRTSCRKKAHAEAGMETLHGFFLQNENDNSFCIYVSIKIYWTMMKCFREDDNGTVYLFIRGK